MNSKSMVCVLAAALTAQGCSSRPREFAPVLAAPPASTAEFDAAHAECTQLLVAGKLDKDGRLASGAGGVATGAGVAAAGGAAAAATAGYAGMAVAAATVVLLPFAVLGGAWGLSRMKRGQKEKAIKTAISGCLKERGYEVAGWKKTGRKVQTAKAKADPAPADGDSATSQAPAAQP
ncbi:MAG TPA: hypothetical protein VNJ05_03640 [Sphingomicrobium sp.]|nr:hypothetical protein [Sphingomicrobium sp.]